MSYPSYVPAAAASSALRAPFAARSRLAAFIAEIGRLGFYVDPLDLGRSLILATDRRVRVPIEFHPGTVRLIDVDATLAKTRAVRATADVCADRLQTAEAYGRLYDRARHSLH